MTKPRKEKSSGATPTDPAMEFTVESLYKLMKEKLDDLDQKVATKSCIDKLLNIIEEQKQKMSEMEDKIAVLESHITQLKKSSDNLEQYQRRLCLRINGIDLQQEGQIETGEEWLQKVKNVFNEFKIEIPDTVVDRAHRIGKVVKVNGVHVRQMIVHFTTWPHRTMVYNARKNSGKYKIKLDLTKHRVHLLKKANELLKLDQHSFAFCNINCQPCWYNNGKYHFFNDLHELERLFNNR